MDKSLLLKNVRPMGGAPVDLLVRDGLIETVTSGITATGDETTILDGQSQLLLPGLVNAHAHIDKNLLGLGWHTNRVPGTTIRDFVDNERRIRIEENLDTRTQSAREIRAAIAAGITHIRTHVDIDTDAGLDHFEGVLGSREEFREEVTMQTVAFPQSGMLVRPGTVELLEEALKMGADAIGGLDPSTVDRDPVKHLDTIFELAVRYGVELDIHVHEPGMLGAFAVELIAERTRVLGLQGRVTISHVFCLGMIAEPYLEKLIGLLQENRITIMSLGSGQSPFPPLKRLHEAGIRLCTGTDGVRDTWGPIGGVDVLEKMNFVAYRSGFRKDEDLEMLLGIATYGGAAVMGDDAYGLQEGNRADFIVLPAETPAEAVVERPQRTFVVKGGRLVAAGGSYLPAD